MTTNKKKIGIYIHVPFCLRKCPYCDFFSIGAFEKDSAAKDSAAKDTAVNGQANSRLMQKKYAEALAAEIEFYGKKYGLGKTSQHLDGKDNPASKTPERYTSSERCELYEADTVYFGGGTPSILEIEDLEMIFYALRRSFPIAPAAEITLECNPATADLKKFRDYRSLGINRLSIGAQSMNDDVLKNLGRLHTVAQTEETVALAREAGFENISLDLMFAIPGQTDEEWLESVKRTMALKPQHISLYSLEFIENTKFWRDREDGIMIETEAEADRRMYEDALRLMAQNDYLQYEISNVSLNGDFKSCHNLKYWALEDYLGLGPSAHSYMEGARHYNVADLEEYIAQAGSGQVVRGYELNSFEDNVSEYIFTGLRRNSGINLENFRSRFGKDIWDIYDAKCRGELNKFVKGGFAEYDDKFLRLTVKGMNISNRIMSLFV